MEKVSRLGDAGRVRGEYFVGVDLHRHGVQVCVMGREGDVIEEERFRLGRFGRGEAVLAYLKRWRRGGRVAVEAIGLNRWLVDGCRAEGLEVVVVDPGKLGLKAAGKKTDRRDAREIARRLFLGDIDRHARTYYPSTEEYGVRKAVRLRHSLIAWRQQVINQMRAVLNAYRVVGRGGKLYSAPNLRWLEEQAKGEGVVAETVRVLLPVLRSVQEQIQGLTVRMEEVAQGQAATRALLEAPSVGAMTATALVYELGDVKRFRATRSVASYSGMVSRVNDSGDKSHHGRLTKRGSRTLRWVLGQWATRLLRHEPEVRRWAARRLQRMHKHKVRMALARRLLIGVYVALRDGVPFSLARALGH
jgi:transposase